MTSILLRRNIKLVVCDMAGTIINERGIIYKSIGETLKEMGCVVSEKDEKRWYGRDKREVLYNEINKNLNGSSIKRLAPLVRESEKILIRKLEESYFKDEKITLIDDKLLDLFENWRMKGIKVALNTGYNKNFQKKIIKNLNLSESIDDFISSEEVKRGRPYPYMINKLMERNNIINARYVCKIGDTVNDMMEGKNANCGLTVGVLSGAGKIENLLNETNIVVDKVTDLIENNKVYN